MLSNTSLLFLLFLATFLPQSSAQAPQPAQTPPPAQSEVTTLRAGAQLVVVDVVVTDKSQNPVRNLNASDFALLESGHPQQIKSFEEHTAQSAKPIPPMPVFPPGIFTNYSPAPIGSAVNILLVDTLNTPVLDQIYLHDQFHKYINTSKPGAPMAIFGLTTKLLLLQSFTSDPELLKAAINNKNIKNSPLIDRVSGGNSTQVSDDMTDFKNSAGGIYDPHTIPAIQQFEAQQTSFQLQLRAKYTLDAINQLARYLAGLPGRKNLIWFSGSFPLNVLPDGTISNPSCQLPAPKTSSARPPISLARPRSPSIPSTPAALMTISHHERLSTPARAPPGQPQTLRCRSAKIHLQTAAENSTMTRDGRGDRRPRLHQHQRSQPGRQQCHRCRLQLLHPHLLPHRHRTGTANFRKIQVKLQQSGVTLAYRRGYYRQRPKHARNYSPRQQNQKRLCHGSSTDRPHARRHDAWCS